MHAAVSQGQDGLTASWCLQHVLCSFAQSHTRGYTVRWLHPGFAAPVCTTDQGTWLGKALWALHPSICHALCTATVPLEGAASAREGSSQGDEESSQSPAVFSRELLPAPAGGSGTRDVFVLPLLCAPHKALVVTGLECHRSDRATIERSVGCNNSTQR